jgi:peptidoglycan/LPS O-acetylase OafA/YrhL
MSRNENIRMVYCGGSIASNTGVSMKAASPALTAWPSRFELLDGLRGLAALAVVLHHLQVFTDGHFAVMVFFVISGYCITASAESCRRAGLGFGPFMMRRVRRIYPPYLLAVLFYVATRAVKAAMGGPNELQRPALDWLQNLTLTQWVSNVFHPISWPSANPHLFVPAFWSLNYEEQFYLVIAVCLVAATAKRFSLIVPVLLLAAIGLIWNWSIPGNWVCGFFLEYWLHFALGSCLYFSLCVFTDVRSRSIFVSLLVALGLASLYRILPWSAATGADLRSMVELAFLSAVAFGLFFLRPLSLPISRSVLWRPIAAMGTISYSLYLVHQFNLTLVASMAQRVLPSSAPRFVMTAAMVALHLALAASFWYFCERPFLSRKASSPPLAPSPIFRGQRGAASP